MNAPVQKLTAKDFATDQEVRWCPGCGDYAILASMQKTLPELDIPKEKHVFVSGIGCASRFPYYMNTYGFHTIHGRAPTVAMGAKLANPELSVWVVSGDGDALAIGGNHTMHLLRRNSDVKMMLLNNQIYGLTKGQASPTSPRGLVTKSSPYGAVDNPIKPITMALAAGATFVARVHDKDNKLMESVMLAAQKHKGAAFIEILMNCVTFHDGAPVTVENVVASINYHRGEESTSAAKPLLDAITDIGTRETGLPGARLQGERGRTTGQLRLFAQHILDGTYLDQRHDAALQDRRIHRPV